MNMRLRALRIESGLTQQELAQQINSSNKNIWAYEKGNATPPAEVIIAYAKFFDVSTDYLLGLEDDTGARVPAASLPTAAAMGDGMTEKEKALLDAFRKLLPETQDFILRSAQSLHDKKSVT